MNIKEISISVEQEQSVSLDVTQEKDVSIEFEKREVVDEEKVKRAYHDYNFIFNQANGKLELTMISNDGKEKTIEVDLPTEELVKNVNFDTENKQLVIEWENGQITNIPVDFMDEEFLNNYIINNSEKVNTINIGTSENYNEESDNEIPTTKAVKKIVNSNSSNPIIKITYDELKALRDNAELIPGQQYRIIDYDCTTTQLDTASAMHPFDIIVTADDEKTLNENARACLSERDNNYFKQKYEIPAEIIGAQFKEGIEYSDIDTQYIISIDVSSYEVNDDIVDGGANVGRNDYIAEIGYADNNEGNEVPVFWKNDPDYVDEGVDYQDTYYYVGQEEFEGVVYDKWRKIESDGIGWEDDSQIYILTNVVVDVVLGESKEGYLENNLQSWEIKYSLDNDKTKFLWACDGLQIYTDDSIWFKYVGEIEVNGEKYYAWENKEQFETNNYLLSKTLDLKLDDSLDKYDYVNDGVEEGYSTVISSVEGLDYYIQKGKGVVYYMKDDKGNECGYDFKNIIYKHGGNGGVLYLYYTFNKKGKLMDLSLTDISGEYACTDNIIKPYREEGLFYCLNSTIFNGTGFFTNNILDYQNINNFFSGYCGGNNIGQQFMSNIINEPFTNNIVGNSFYNNTIVVACNEKIFESGIFGTTIDDDYFNNKENENTFDELPPLNSSVDYSKYIDHKNKIMHFEKFITLDLQANSWLRDYWDYEMRLGQSLRYIVNPNLSYSDRKKLYNVKYYGTIGDWCKIKIVLSNYYREKQFFNILEFQQNPLFSNDLGYNVLDIPEGVTELSECLFNGFKNIEKIFIPSSIKVIGAQAFEPLEAESNCILDYKGTLTDWCNIDFKRERDDTTSQYSNPMRYAVKFYINSNSKALEEINIPDNVSVIRQFAFNLPKLNIPINLSSSVKKVEAYAIWSATYNPHSIIYIPKTVETIEERAINSFKFVLCESEKDLPGWTQSSPSNGYINWCENCSKILYNVNKYEIFSANTDEFLHINNADFVYTLNKINLPPNATHYEPLVNGVTNNNIVYKVRIKEINGGQTASNPNTKLNTVYLSDKIIEIPGGAFSYCTSLHTIVIDGALTKIPYGMCRGCSSLVNINIPETVTTIGDSVFYKCSQLTNINIHNNITDMGSSALSNTAIEILNTNNITSTYGVWEGMYKLKKLIVPKIIEQSNYSFHNVPEIEYIEFYVMESFGWYNEVKEKLKTLIIRTPNKVCELTNSSLNLDNCPNIYVYVPDELVEEYKVATNWVALADRIKPLSEYVEE